MKGQPPFTAGAAAELFVLVALAGLVWLLGFTHGRAVGFRSGVHAILNIVAAAPADNDETAKPGDDASEQTESDARRKLL